MSCVDVRERCRDSPLRARSLFTVRAAISSARSSEAPWSSSLSLMCSYWRARFVPSLTPRGGIGSSFPCLLYFRLPVRPTATPLDIRPVTPDDRAIIRRGFERLGPQSRYRRFFGPMPGLGERDLDYLTRADHHDHEAFVAIDPESGDGVGVARYVRTAPDAAEPAIAVVDDWQGRGVGTRLLDALVERALAEGIARFDA